MKFLPNTPRVPQLNNAQSNSLRDVAFGFLQSLADELSIGRVDLPSFPEIAVRVQRVLADGNSSLDQVARVVGSEPALAAKLLRIANSTSHNRGGKALTDLRTAINRMGFDVVRSVSMSFAMAQIRKNTKLESVKQSLDELWERSILVAAFAFVLARTCAKINPDEAMLAGIMHGIGKLYILTRAANRPALNDSAGTLHHMMNDWHTEIGKSILENWEFADDVIEAVANQHDLAREDIETADLCDILAIAVLMAPLSTDLVSLQLALQGLPAAQRLGLDEATVSAVIMEFDEEISALREALG